MKIPAWLRPHFLLICLLLLAACQDEPLAPTVTVPLAETPTLEALPLPTETGLSASGRVDQPADPTAIPESNQTPLPPVPSGGDGQRLPTEAEIATLARLAQNELPARDEVDLLRAFRGVSDEVPAPPLVSEPLPAGSRQSFQTLNFASNEIVTVEAVLLHVSDHAYFWFDTTVAEPFYDEATLQSAGSTFDEIYDLITFHFGPDAQPGVDGDSRVYILHVAPQNLCQDFSCGIAGYFSSFDVIPPTVDPESNGHELFIINLAAFAQESYFATLTHEFRHLVEDNHDRGDWDWEVEGSATMAQLLWGDLQGPLARASLFLENPDRNLFSWPDSAPAIGYGHGFLFNQFLFQQMGWEAYRAFAVSSGHGFAAVDLIAPAFNLPQTGEAYWQDMLVALAIHDQINIPLEYDLGLEGLLPLTIAPLAAGSTAATTVNQFGSDYYRLEGEGSTTLTFRGNTLVGLLATTAPSGHGYWLTERGNQGDARLTRSFDLRDVSRATLEYDIYFDLEAGYDFGYVSLSADGANWQPLVGTQMVSAAAGADPAGAAYADHFYTGFSNGWQHETIDLTPFAGQQVQLRFQLITDPILTHAGLALDNIIVPELAFYDFAEGDVTDWVAEGFMAVTNYAPQRWSLQLITFPDDTPSVTQLALPANGVGNWQIDLNPDESPPILIVAGMTPQTLQPGSYDVGLQK